MSYVCTAIIDIFVSKKFSSVSKILHSIDNSFPYTGGRLNALQSQKLCWHVINFCNLGNFKHLLIVNGCKRLSLGVFKPEYACPSLCMSVNVNAYVPIISIF